MSQDEPNQTDQGVETGVAVGGGNSGTITVNKITNLGTSGSVIVAGGLVVVALILFMGINLLSSDDTATAVEEEVAGVEQNADEDTSSVRSGEPAAATDSEADGGAVADDNDQGVAPLEVVAEPAVATEPTPDPKFDTDRLSGLFNVAVLQFSTGDSDDASALYEAEDAADELVDFLRSELGPDAALSDIDIGYYERAEEREDLNKLAIDMNANMVVTATLRAEDGESVFSPEFLIPSGSLTEAEELSGFHALGLERRWNESFLSETVSTELRNVVKDRSQALVHLVRGLSAYRGKEYDRATTHFSRLVNSADCQGPLGAISDDAGIQALAYTFLANVTIFSATDAVDQAPAFDKADRCFALALRAFPDSPRAELGRAAISFQRTREVCNSGVETDALVAPVELLDALISTEAQYLAARSNYRTAVENGRKEIPFLETATNIGIGRIQLCLSLAGEPRWDEARASFGEAVTAYAVAQSGEQRRLASLTAEAYAGIGLVVLRGPRTFDPEVAEQSNEAWAAFSAAVTDEERAQAQTLVDAATAKSQAAYQEHFASAEAAFDEAIQLVGDDGRRRLFHAMRANARSTLGNLEGSTQDCIEAQNGDTELSCPDFGPSFFDLPPDEVLGLAITGSSTALFARVATLLITVGAMLVLVERTVLARRD